MKNILTVLTFSLVFVLISCGGNVKEGAKQEQKEDQNPPLTSQYFKELYDKADYTEIIFENLPFTLSQENKSGIQMMMSYMDNKPPLKIDFNCPLFGHQLYQIEGEVVLEADIFMGPQCNYYVFYKGEEKFYNAMTPKGVQFFESLINKTKGQ